MRPHCKQHSRPMVCRLMHWQAQRNPADKGSGRNARLDHQDGAAVLMEVWRNSGQQHRPPPIHQVQVLAVCGSEMQLPTSMHLCHQIGVQTVLSRPVLQAEQWQAHGWTACQLASHVTEATAEHVVRLLRAAGSLRALEAHRRVGQPPRQASKVPLPADVGTRPEQHVQAEPRSHLQIARQICRALPIVHPWAGLVQVPWHICLQQRINAQPGMWQTGQRPLLGLLDVPCIAAQGSVNYINGAMMGSRGGNLDCVQTQGLGPMQPVLPVRWWDSIVVKAASWKEP